MTIAFYYISMSEKDEIVQVHFTLKDEDSKTPKNYHE